MDELELKSILQSYRSTAIGQDDGELSNDRENALKHFHGKPYGDEQEGRSQIVTRDLAEAVDSVSAAVLKVLFSSGDPVEFEPRSADDVLLAKQETAYVNYQIMERNNGFLALHDAIQDALILRNGYIFYWWDESRKSTEEKYNGLTIPEKEKLISDLENDDDIIEYEVIEEFEDKIPIQGVDGIVEETIIDCTIRIVRKEGKLMLSAAPPEEVRVANNARGQAKDADFLEHECIKTKTELIEMGIPEDFLDDLPGLNEIQTETEEARSVTEEEGDEIRDADPSMREHKYRSTFVRVDFDDDGIAELRHIISVDEEIPEGFNNQVDEIQCASFAMKRIAHRHLGISLDDQVGDLQRIHTVLMRQILDNIYLTNWNQIIVNDNVVLDDFLINSPGGVKRTNSIGAVQNDAMPLPVQPISHQILPILDRVEAGKARRTGISSTTDGTLDPDVLRETNTGTMEMTLSRALEKIELYTRMIVETGFKDLVKGVHKVLLQNQDKADRFEFQGQLIDINPREWRDREKLKVNVGLGRGSNQEKLQAMMAAMPVLGQFLQQGMISPQEGYNFWSDLSEVLGFISPSRYVMDPRTPEFQQAMQQRQRQQQQMLQAQMQIPLQQEQIRTQGRIQEQQIQAGAKLTQEKMRAIRDRLSQDAEARQFLMQYGLDIAQLEIDAFDVGVNAGNLNKVADLGGKRGTGV